MLPRVGGGSILCVVGARPNFMKIAPVIRAMNAATPPLPVRLLHTGQHYDPEMNSQYFQGLGIPDTNTVVGSSPEHILAAVIDELQQEFEPAYLRDRPEERSCYRRLYPGIELIRFYL